MKAKPKDPEIGLPLLRLAELAGKSISSYRLNRMEAILAERVTAALQSPTEEQRLLIIEKLEDDLRDRSATEILVTGGAGFIGSNFTHYMLDAHPDYQITVFDALSYAGNMDNLADLKSNPKFKFIKGDVREPDQVESAVGACDIVVNFAAETHVDRSIHQDEREFFGVNVEGVLNLLNAARRHRVELFLHISTDEVYGALQEGDPDKTEKDKLRPTSQNPYAFAKSCADKYLQFRMSREQVPIIIARPSNAYGPRQYPEKLLPLLITNSIENRPLPIYGDGSHVREWLYVEDLCRALDLLLKKGVSGEAYNIGSGPANRRRNREVAEAVRQQFPNVAIMLIKDRPYHDIRYSLDNSKIRDLGWEPQTDFAEGLKKTTEWYATHEQWWRPLKERFFASDFARNLYPPEVWQPREAV